jgi:hypothetical protein
MNDADSILEHVGDGFFALARVVVEATPLARLINNATLCKPLVGASNRLTK